MKNSNAAMLKFSLVPIVMLLSACGGGGHGDYDGNQNNQPVPILQVGMQRQFVGNATRTVVYTSPTATTPNNTLAYTYTESQNVYQAPFNAPAYFDINSVYTYTVTQDPGVGVVPISQTVDDYRNLYFNGPNQFTSELEQTSTTRSNDETANALGGGPYTQTTSTTSNYPTPRSGLTFPLQTGETNPIPQSSNQTITFADLNSANAPPPNGSNVGCTRTRTQNNDGSFSFQQTGVTGTNETLTENSDGSAAYTITSASSTNSTTIGAPVLASGVYTIPVNRTVTSSTPSNTNYSAVDWYPGAALPPTPLIVENQTVVGPVMTLPAQCAGAYLQPDMFEVDTNTTNLNTVNGLYTVTATRAFNSNGVAVCTLTTTTANSYTLNTGALFSTTTTQTTSVLTSMN
jgi:hypothetical protein